MAVGAARAGRLTVVFGKHKVIVSERGRSPVFIVTVDAPVPSALRLPDQAADIDHESDQVP